MSEYIKIIILSMIIVGVLVVGPLLTIWALNSLFPTILIPYTIKTWFAIILLGAFLRANVSVKGK